MPRREAHLNTFSEWSAVGFDTAMNPKVEKEYQVTVGEGLCIMHLLAGEQVPEGLLKHTLETHTISKWVLEQLIVGWNKLVQMTPVSVNTDIGISLIKMNVGMLSVQLSRTSERVYDEVKQALMFSAGQNLLIARTLEQS
ncbi:hypothetical protein KKG44_04390 [Patescibacteria group bacterium]|nr:hypothetical protein [Patescibacteria group bacterium]